MAHLNECHSLFVWSIWWDSLSVDCRIPSFLPQKSHCLLYDRVGAFRLMLSVVIFSVTASLPGWLLFAFFAFYFLSSDHCCIVAHYIRRIAAWEIRNNVSPWGWLLCVMVLCLCWVQDQPSATILGSKYAGTARSRRSDPTSHIVVCHIRWQHRLMETMASITLDAMVWSVDANFPHATLWTVAADHHFGD